MTTHDDFHALLRANPDDSHTHRVYADFIRDHGTPRGSPAGSPQAEVVAARLNWVADAMDHVRAGPTSGAPALSSAPLADHERGLPEWVRRWNGVRGVRAALHGTPAAEDGIAREHLHMAHMHALGLADPARITAGYNVARGRAWGPPHGYNRALGAVANTLMLHTLGALDHPFDEANTPIDGVNDTPHRERYQRQRAFRLETQMLADHAKSNPPPDTHASGAHAPVQLARNPLSWVRDKLFGKADPVRQPGDGIVHKGDPSQPGRYNPEVHAEENAVKQSIRLHGGTEAATAERTKQYTNWVAEFVKQKPDHEAVKRYVAEASKLKGAGIFGAGPELTRAVHPLVGAINLLMSAHGKDSRFVKPVSEAAPGYVPIEHRTAATATGSPYEVVDDGPIDLSDVPDAPAENRHEAILRMSQEGLRVKGKTGKETTEDIIKHLMEAHGVPSRPAAQAAIRKAFAVAKIKAAESAKRGKPTKLAAYKGGPITPDHLTGKTAARDPYTQEARGFAGQVAGTALAYHLRQIQQDHPHLQGMVEAALTGRAYGSSAKQDDPFVAVGKAISKLKHPLADAHDWGALADQHAHNRKVEQFVRQHVLPVGGTDLEYWDRVRRGLATGKAKNAEQFWARFERANTGLTREQAVEAMHRIGDRELDRAYLSTIREEGLKRNPDWRDVMGAHK